MTEAEPFFDQARGIFAKIPEEQGIPEDLEDIVMSDLNLGLVYAQQKKYAEAEERFKNIITFTEKMKRGKPSKPDTVFAELCRFAAAYKPRE